MQPFVEGIGFQREAAGLYDFLIALRLFQERQVGVYQLDVLPVQADAAADRPVVLVVSGKQIAGVKRQNLLVQLVRFVGELHDGFQLARELVKLEHVQRHVLQLLELIAAAACGNAVAQAVAACIEDRAETADERFEGVLGVRALLVGPEHLDEFVVGNDRVDLEYQILQERHALFGLGDDLIVALVVHEDAEASEHANPNLICHVTTPVIPPGSPRAP